MSVKVEEMLKIHLIMHLINSSCLAFPMTSSVQALLAECVVSKSNCELL